MQKQITIQIEQIKPKVGELEFRPEIYENQKELHQVKEVYKTRIEKEKPIKHTYGYIDLHKYGIPHGVRVLGLM